MNFPYRYLLNKKELYAGMKIRGTISKTSYFDRGAIKIDNYVDTD